MSAFLTELYGPNWHTSLTADLQAVAILVVTYFYEGGKWPISPEGWAAIGYGILGIIKGHHSQDARPLGEHTRTTDPPPPVPVINQIPPTTKP